MDIFQGKNHDIPADMRLKTGLTARWPNDVFTQAGLVKGATELLPVFKGKKGTKEGIGDAFGGKRFHHRIQRDQSCR